MDPVSAVGFAGAVVGIVDVIVKSMDHLLDLQSKYKAADLKIGLLVGQISTLKTALSHIAELTGAGLSAPEHGQLLDDLSTSVQGCEAIIAVLDGRLSTLRMNENDELATSSKLRLLWDDATMHDYLNILNNHINALHLLLTVLQCRSALERHDMLQEAASRRVFDQVKDDTSSSLLLLQDTYSLNTNGSGENARELGPLDAIFDFDREVFNSRAYLNATRSNMIFSIQAGVPEEKHGPSEPSEPSRPSTAASRLRISTRFSIHSARIEESDDSDSIRPLLSGRQKNASAHRVNPGMGKISSVDVLNLPQKSSSFQSTRESITSSVWGASSIFKFGQRRNLTSRPEQLWLAPIQAPQDAIKVLVLGIAESGKTTLIRSLEAAFGYFSVAVRKSYRSAADIDTPMDPAHVPSVSEILRSYTRTTGITVSTFEADGKSYKFYDVGGARSERKKWVHAFENVRALIFMFDAACFGEPLQEDDTGNAMWEQLMLWESIANSYWFTTTDIVVIFTKVDKISEYFLAQPTRADYEPMFKEPPKSADQVLQGLVKKLMSLLRESPAGQERPSRKLTFWHASIANSTTEMAEVALSALNRMD